MTTAPEDPSTPSDAELTPTELAAWRGLLRVTAAATQALDAQLRAEHGLSLSAYEVLMVLGEAADQRMRMTEIAERILLSRSGLTRLVDRLCALGYVARSAAETDRRGAYAELTAAGAACLAVARRTHLAGVRRVFLDRLSVTDRIVLGDVWARMEAVAPS